MKKSFSARLLLGAILFSVFSCLTAAPAAPAQKTPAKPAPAAKKAAVQKPAPRRPAPPRRAIYGTWGINVDSTSAAWPLFAEEMMLAEELGVSMVRLTLDWSVYAPNPRVRHLGTFNGQVREVMRHRLKVVGVLGGKLPDHVKNPGAIMPGAKEFDAAQFDAFLEYVENVTKNFRDKIRCWELHPPTDPRFTPEQQRKFAAAVAETIRKVDGTLTILPPAVPAEDRAGVENWSRTGKTFSAQNCSALNTSVDPEIWWNSPGKYKAPPRTEFWVTSSGLPGGAANYPCRYLLKELFRAVGTSPFASELLLISDPKYNCRTEQYNFRRSDLGRFRRVREVTLADVAKLQPEKSQLLVAPPRLELPPAQLEILIQYLKRGGNLFVPHDNDGTFSPALLKRLHVGLEQPGTYDRINGGPSCPDMPKTLARIDPITLQGITGYKLPPGDRFVSVVQLSSSKITTTVAGLYSYGSDFRGRLLLVRGHSDYFGGGCTPDAQARRVARDLILWRAQGASKLFYHKMTAREESTEVPQHYGLLTRNLERKPAFFAYQTLIRMMPDGSSRPAIQRLPGDLWLASWQRPDKSIVYALWSRLHWRNVKLVLPAGGKITEAYSYTGQKQTLAPGNVWIGDRVLYFVAPPGVKVQPK